MSGEEFLALEPSIRQDQSNTWGLNLLSGTTCGEDEATSNIRKSVIRSKVLHSVADDTFRLIHDFYGQWDSTQLLMDTLVWTLPSEQLNFTIAAGSSAYSLTHCDASGWSTIA